MKFIEKGSLEAKLLSSLILLLAVILFSLTLYKSIITTSINSELLGAFMVTTLLFMSYYFIKNLQWKVKLNENSIKFKMHPLSNKYEKINWEDVRRCEITQSTNSNKWSGQLVRFSRDIGFSFSGGNGISLIKKNGKKYFIGLNNVEELGRKLRKWDISVV